MVKYVLGVSSGDNASVRALVVDALDKALGGGDGRSVGAIGEEVGGQISRVGDTLHGEVVGVGTVEATLDGRSESALELNS